MDPDVKIKPDPDDPSAAQNVANDNMTRTSFKLQLQRKQILEIERKEQQKNLQQLQQQQQQAQQQRFFPNSSASQPFSVPRTSVQPRGLKANLPAMNLPTSVLKVLLPKYLFRFVTKVKIGRTCQKLLLAKHVLTSYYYL